MKSCIAIALLLTLVGQCIFVTEAAAQGASDQAGPAPAIGLDADGLRWNSMPIYIGKTWDPAAQARVNTYLAQIESTGPDGSGYFEIWTDPRPYYQESDADHEALLFRARCDATRSNACMRGPIPPWTERLDRVLFVH